MRKIGVLRVLVWLVLIVTQAPAFATDVSGDITIDTTWTNAASPFNVTGSVRVIGGAVLTIEAGVSVLMGPGTSFTAFGGRVEALGTAGSQIVFTSVNDQVGAPVSAAPGDWQQFQVLSGSGQSASNLAFVTIRFGLGMLINNASPTLDGIALEDNAGPAITIDLLSSPSGTATAARNSVNGIVVPAGEVTQHTRWSLLGIPYVVADGIVHVGARPAAVTMAPISRFLEPGQTSDFLVSLAEPTDLSTTVAMSSTAPGVATVEPVVTIPAGAFSALAQIEALSAGNATISATVGSDSAVATVTVASQPQLMLPTVFSLSAGRTRDISLSRSPPSSFATPVTVTLMADPVGLVQVPATAVIPAGTASVIVPLAGIAEGSAVVSASAVGYSDDSSAITVLPLTMSWPSPLVVPIGSVVARLSFSDVAPPGGMTVTLDSSDPTRLTLPASMPVPAGATGLNVPLTGLQEGPATLTANNASYGTAAVNATVEEISVSFDIASRLIPAGFTEPFTVTLSRPAPQGGIVVSLISSDPAVANALQTSVSIAAGQSAAPVEVRGLSEGVATIVASGTNLTPGELALTVGPAAALRFLQPDNTVGRGLRSRTTRIQLRMGEEEFRPRRNVEVSFANPDSASVTLPTMVTVLAGAAQSEVATVGNLVTSSPVAVNAEALDVQSTAIPLEVSVVEPTLTIEGLDNTRSLLSTRDSFHLQWQVPGVIEQQVAAADQVFDLGILDAAPANVVDGIYEFGSTGSMITTTEISAGGWLSASRWVGVPNTFGTYKVRAFLPGFGEWISVEQRSVGQNLEFSVPTFVSGKLMESNFVKIRRQQGGDPYAPNTPLTVAISSSDPSRVTASGVVVIPSNSSQVAVIITGKELTASTLLNASATGYDGAPSLSVSVVEPTFQFAGLQETRVLGAARDQFNLAFQVPSSTHLNQTPRQVVADVEVIDASPVDIVPGIYRSSTGGSPSTFIDFQSFPINGVVGYVGTPDVTGSYAIRATVQGLSSGPLDSPIQTVTGNTLRFDDASVTVGNGLRRRTSLRLLSQPSPTPVIINMSCASGNCSAETPRELYGTQLDVDVVGIGLGADTLTADSAPTPYGAASLPVTVEALSGSFGFDPGDGKCEGGWHIIVGPGVANQELIAEISVVDQSPPGIYTGTYQLSIYEGEDTSQTCFGLLLDPPASAGTYRLRATIAGFGSFDSELITATAELSLSPPTLVAARGLNSRITVFSTIADPSPVDLAVNCVPNGVCTPQLPWAIPASNSGAVFSLFADANGAALLNVSAPGYPNVTAAIDVRDPRIQIFAGSGNVQVGSDRSIDIVLNPVGSSERVYAAVPITFTLSGSGPEASIPPTVELASGQSSVRFDVQGLQAGSYSFTVDWPGVGVFDGPMITVTP